MLEWVSRDNSLAQLFRILPCLKSLTWESWGDGLTWHQLPMELCSAFVNLLKSPALTTIEITPLDRLPLSIFRAFNCLKNLCLTYNIFQDDEPLPWPPPIPMPHLQVLVLNSPAPNDIVMRSKIMLNSPHQICIYCHLLSEMSMAWPFHCGD